MANAISIENRFLDQMKATGQYISETLTEMKIPTDILESIPKEIITNYHILPFKRDEDYLYLVTNSQQTLKQKASIQAKLNIPIKLVLASEENIRLALNKFYGISKFTMLGIRKAKDIEVDTTPQQNKLNAMLQSAASKRTSDIHILPTSAGVSVMFRINGHMTDVSAEFGFEASEAGNIINLLKQMDESGNADISKTNMPNEGSFFINHGDIPIFVRMETLPIGNEGEWQKVNLRLLPQSSIGTQSKKLDDIGYTDEDLSAIKNSLFRNATGMFINSGPTGSGKTTSLYAQIHYVRDVLGEEVHVITIDDPIEIREERFTQVQVRKAKNDDISLTDLKILSASLRSDPDIILYNEIRDKEGALVAMQASATGHKLFSTVHAADCIRTISRLLDLEVSKTTLLSELKMIISQRLVAKLCPYCSRPHEITKEEREILTTEELLYLTDANGNLLEHGSSEEIRNCPYCTHGSIGRTAVAEYVIFNMEIRDALLNQRSFKEIYNVLKANGYKTMWEKGLPLVKKGEIELSELIRVIGKED